jgi:hypothetical protein
MGASATRQVQLTIDQYQLGVAIPAVLHTLGWSFSQTAPTSYRASAKIGWLSWGENIMIDFSYPGWLKITSRCAFPLQLVDWGKNNQNIDKLIEQLPFVVPG